VPWISPGQKFQFHYLLTWPQFAAGTEGWSFVCPARGGCVPGRCCSPRRGPWCGRAPGCGVTPAVPPPPHLAATPCAASRSGPGSSGHPEQPGVPVPRGAPGTAALGEQLALLRLKTRGMGVTDVTWGAWLSPSLCKAPSSTWKQCTASQANSMSLFCGDNVLSVSSFLFLKEVMRIRYCFP